MSPAKSTPIKASRIKGKSTNRKPGFNTQKGLKGFQTADPIVPIAPTANPIASTVTESSIVETMANAPSGSSLARALIVYQKDRATPAGIALKAFAESELNWVSPIAKEIIKEVKKEPIFKVEILAAELTKKVSREASKGFLLINAIKVEAIETYSKDNYAENNRFRIVFTRENYDPISSSVSSAGSISGEDGIRWVPNWKRGVEELFTKEEIVYIRAFAECWWRETIELH